MEKRQNDNSDHATKVQKAITIASTELLVKHNESVITTVLEEIYAYI